MAATLNTSSSYCVERETKLSARRFNKHVAERKRRARINTSLDQLKDMILSTMHKNPEDYDKMEKADILDLTVKFLKGVQQQQQCQSQAYKAPAPQAAPRPVHIVPAPLKPTAVYQTGYIRAMDQVQRYATTSDLDDATAARLAAHLKARSMASLPRVKRCEVPSARVCRNITRELSTLSPSRRAALSPVTESTVTSLNGSFAGMTSLSPSPVNHRVSPAQPSVWRPWEGQVSA